MSVGQVLPLRQAEDTTGLEQQIDQLTAAVTAVLDDDTLQDADTNSTLDHLGRILESVKTDVGVAQERLERYESRDAAVSRAHAVVEFEADGTIIRVSEHFLDLTHYTPAELSGLHYRQLAAADTTDDLTKLWRSLNTGQSAAGDFAWTTAEKSIVWLRGSFTPMLDGNNLRGVVFHGSDITETKTGLVQIEAMVKQATPMVFCDTDLVVRYMNPAALNTLRTLENHLPVPADQIVGQSIDIFHKNPAHQRGMLANPANFPMTTQIKVGPETLDLEVKNVHDEQHNLLGTMVTWEIVTERLALQKEIEQIQAMMRQATAMVFCDNDLVVRFMNPAALRTLTELESHLPVRADQIVGQSIDIFHKNPAHQRGLLANPANFPMTTQIPVGPETLDLEVKTVFDDSGQQLGTMVTWEVITERLALEAEVGRIQAMVEQASAMVFADTEFVVRFMNPAALNTLRSLEQHLPVRADEIIGQSIDIFHKNPGHQRKILKDPSNLPMSTQIAVGPETLQLEVKAVFDDDRQHLGSMVTWEVVTEKLAMEEKIRKDAERERQEAEQTQQKVSLLLELMNKVNNGNFDVRIPDMGDDAVGRVAKVLASTVESLRQALLSVQEVSGTVASASNEMTSASEEISRGAQQQAARLEETASSLEQITTTVRQNADNAREARSLANGSRDIATQGGDVVSSAVQAMNEINESSKKISDIITTIDEIAFQTNLLALNAAVEAARAGEQGRGFAVVAGEVRNLAQRSASSAKEIKSLIQDSARKVMTGTELVNKSGETLGDIVTSVKQVTDIVAEIAAASEEQLTAIQTVNAAVTQMDQVTQANANQTEELAGTSSSVLDHAKSLEQMVSRFDLGQARHTQSYAPAASGFQTTLHALQTSPATYTDSNEVDFMEF